MPLYNLYTSSCRTALKTCCLLMFIINPPSPNLSLPLNFLKCIFHRWRGWLHNNYLGMKGKYHLVHKISLFLIVKFKHITSCRSFNLVRNPVLMKAFKGAEWTYRGKCSEYAAIYFLNKLIHSDVMGRNMQQGADKLQLSRHFSLDLSTGIFWPDQRKECLNTQSQWQLQSLDVHVLDFLVKLSTEVFWQIGV